MPSPAPPLPGTGADGGGRASGASGEGDGTGSEGYSLVSEYWGNGLSIYDPEGNKIHTVMAGGVVPRPMGSCFHYRWTRGWYSEPRHVKKLRSWAISECLDHIRADDQFTDCISVGPGTNGSQLWDSAFAAQAFLEAGIYNDKSDLDEHVEDQRMFDCVNVLLKMQNTNGGYASNETKRGGAILEILNPSQVFSVLEYLCKKTCM
eukprot:Em0004g610a